MFFVEHGFVSRVPFSGVYASFADVPGDDDVEADQAAAAVRGVARGPSRDEATDLPQLRRAHSLMPLVAAMLAGGARKAPLNILDFGGAAGVDFANLLAAVDPSIDVRYLVVDFPKVCAVGRDHWRDDKRISFSDTLPQAAQFDLVYSWSSIQYVPDPLSLLAQFASYRPSRDPSRRLAIHVRRCLCPGAGQSIRSVPAMGAESPQGRAAHARVRL